jgi:type II secretory pathway component PulF
MKPLVRALIATIVTIGLFFLYAALIRHRATYYVAQALEMPLSFRVQVGVSNFLTRFWWVLAFPVAGFWGVLFSVSDAVRGRNKEGRSG